MNHQNTYVLLALKNSEEPILVVKSSKEECEDMAAEIGRQRRVTNDRLKEVVEKYKPKNASEVHITNANEYRAYTNDLMMEEISAEREVLKMPEAKWYEYYFIIL